MESTAANVSSLDMSYSSLVNTCYYKIKCITCTHTCTCNYASQNNDGDDVPSLPTHFFQQVEFNVITLYISTCTHVYRNLN